MDRGIEDVTEHFVYQPKKCPANPQDIPFFLSTRLADTSLDNSMTNGDDDKQNIISVDEIDELKDASIILSSYEADAAQLASRYEEKMIRF